jgi:hypothetical protein
MNLAAAVRSKAFFATLEIYAWGCLFSSLKAGPGFAGSRAAAPISRNPNAGRHLDGPHSSLRNYPSSMIIIEQIEKVRLVQLRCHSAGPANVSGSCRRPKEAYRVAVRVRVIR